MMYTYDQRSGLFLKPTGEVLTTGYAGHAAGRNNPLFNNVREFGPPPRGFVKILPSVTHKTLGPIALQLVYLLPDGTVLKLLNGRDGFYIHGDSATHDASRGCIVLDRNSRMFIDTNLATTSYLEIM